MTSNISPSSKPFAIIVSDDATQRTNNEDDDLEEAKEEDGVGESNIPLSPLVTASVRTSVSDLEKGYDSDGQMGPFFDAVEGEGPLETDKGNFLGRRSRNAKQK